LAHVTSAEVADYEPWLTRVSRPYVGRHGAELDDLVQEGRIATWQALSKGIRPSPDVVRFRMSGWVRLLARQRRHETAPYESLLPLDDYASVPAG
jgi:DNA-directed RNA polymerase specialized sigma24 family protein